MNLYSRSIPSLQGVLTVPGDKSISHRAAILGGLADGVTEVDNFLCSEDCLNTLRAMEQLGARVGGAGKPGRLRPRALPASRGVAMRPHSPSRPIDCGNSGTGMRLLAGMLAACPFDSEMFGDASLSSRPMGRIMSPLEQMGARIEARGSKPGCAPLFIHAGHVRPISYTLPMASAQVKSAILLAGMFAEGTPPSSSPPSRATTRNACSAISAFPAPWTVWLSARKAPPFPAPTT